MSERGGRAGAGTIVFVAAVGAFLGFFLLYPVGLMLRSAFVVEGRWTLALFRNLWEDPNRLAAIRN